MISLIVAMSKNRVIGKDGKMPWHLPNDLKYFKQVTTDNVVVMGRKTFESMGKPLSNRINIILTKDVNYKAEGCLVFNSIDHLLESIKHISNVFVIGGSELYKQFLPIAKKLYITYLNHEFNGDTFFPEYDENEWRITEITKGIIDERNHYEHDFVIAERR